LRATNLRRFLVLAALSLPLVTGVALGQKKNKKPEAAPASAPAPVAVAPEPTPAPAPAPSSAPSSAPVAPPPLEDPLTYEIRVHETEEKVSDLKEKVFRSKARLLLLKEALVGGAFGSSKAVIIHRNEMGNFLKLQQASYSLDGISIFNRTDSDGTLSSQKEFEIFNQPLAPGSHTLSVLLVYRGEGFDVFDYLDKYTFKIKSSTTFTIEDGKILQVRVVGYEKGGPLVKLEDRPTVRYESSISETEDGPGKAPQGGKAKAP
jgi:hypothetical protein